MCRIAGIIDKSNHQLKQDIVLMRDAMHRGGPDHAGVFVEQEQGLALGHRRLSIIELSEAGNQPMFSESGNLVLVFNGEIYNYKELKAELQALGYRFRTDSDSEVIIEAWQEWNTGCFDKFRGMFAIALYDKKRRELILARDHAGIKPLYYYSDGKKLYFASEIRAFNAIKAFEENEQWRVFFLTYGFLPSPVTTLKDVQPMEKGSYAIINVNTLESQQFCFHEDTYEERVVHEAEAIELVRSSVATAVKRHLVADAPLGLFLSGGIDSSLVSLIAKQFKDDLHTLSIDFKDQTYSERYFQDLIAKKIGSNHSRVLLDKELFLSSVPDFMDAMDQPSADGINSYFISKFAKDHGLKAVLSGLGADELFGGYDTFYRSALIKQMKSLPGFILGLSRYFPQDRYRKIDFLKHRNPRGEYLFNRGYFNTTDVAQLLDGSVKEVQAVLASLSTPAFVTKLSGGNRNSFLECNIYMQDQLLRDTDAMSMWHGVEVRVPFLDRDVVKAAGCISSKLKFGHEQPKHLLIKSFKDILPKEVWDRKKQGFVFPLDIWMKDGICDAGIITDKRLQKRFANGHLNWSRYWTHQLSKKFNESESKRAAKKILFLNLTAFSSTGGIEKFNKCFLKALHEVAGEGTIRPFSASAHDHGVDKSYFPADQYSGYNGSRINFVLESIKAAANYDQVIIGHINLAVIGHFIKRIYPDKKVILITHGIEVWQPLKGYKQSLLQEADLILTVSSFTKSKLVQIHRVENKKIKVFPNTLDPYLPVPISFRSEQNLRNRYGLDEDDILLFTLTRLSAKEKYKGYDIVIRCLPRLLEQQPKIKYIIAGQYDIDEKKRLDKLIGSLGVQDAVIFTGFVKNEELPHHYLMVDLFIMPSKKEGFGIVFIEAILHGLPVIAGNADGSVDALRDGELGLLVNPDNQQEITEAIRKTIAHKSSIDEKLELQRKAIKYFGFEQFKKRLKKVLEVKETLAVHVSAGAKTTSSLP